MHILKSLALCATILAAHPAMADTLGTITATMDGKERTWFITAEDGESQSSFVQPMAGMLTGSSFILWGVPDEGIVATMKDVLMLDATLMRGAGGMMPVTPTARYLVTGFKDQWIAVDEGQTEMTLTTIEPIDGGLHVAGTFTATANYTEDMREQDVDRSKSKVIRGSFDVTLPAP